ncbi:hypothetical protein [Pseudalkalibacillus hwajinpoensis]|uniref:Uncharacterized protein n=1 Tax=Guptibacillus hwajinpoensis TaxID=208199 RepID=A0A4U1MJP7_9BACL|nr:hypothetical protein [Pseudalkalibacillus hwajinpoensis]TKD71047.1 hypothetical protein FBF83_10655 [Pseudalkalibacillus hwajinpoensis]
MKKKTIRLPEYTKELLEKRKQEVVKDDIFNHAGGRKDERLTSPTTSTTTEETRLFMEYMSLTNLQNIARTDEEKGKYLTLKKFFKSKRNQQVEVYSKSGVKDKIYTEGKVSAIGRDFVMLTNLRERIWLPYNYIEAANIPFGIPNYSNSHQHYIYDNDLRTKLLRNFGETVSKREILRQQFYEETLQTNLNSWNETWVDVYLSDGTRKKGRITNSTEGKLSLHFSMKDGVVKLHDIQLIKTLRFFQVTAFLFKKVLKVIE